MCLNCEIFLCPRYFVTEPAPTKPELLRRPPPRPEAVPQPSELRSPGGPVVLSPMSKAVRLSAMPGGDVHSFGRADKEMGKAPDSAGTVGGTPFTVGRIPMSVDMSTLVRPTLNRSEPLRLKSLFVCSLSLLTEGMD